MPAPLLVVGVGNDLLADEGLGVHVVRSLAERRERAGAAFDLLEAGTSLLDALPEMARYPRVILVDAVRAGGEPGTIYRAADIAPLLTGADSAEQMSLHQWNLVEVFRAARALGMYPARVELIGAEPDRVEPGLELTPVLAASAQRIVDLLLAEHGEPPATSRDRPEGAAGPEAAPADSPS